MGDLDVRLCVTVDEAGKRLGLSRSMIYKLIGSGELASVKMGRARRVPIEAIDDYLSSCVEQNNGSA